MFLQYPLFGRVYSLSELTLSPQSSGLANFTWQFNNDSKLSLATLAFGATYAEDELHYSATAWEKVWHFTRLNLRNSWQGIERRLSTGVAFKVNLPFISGLYTMSRSIFQKLFGISNFH